MAPLHRKKISISLVIPFAIVAMVFGGLIWKKMQDSREPRPVPQIDQPAAARKVVLFFVTDDARLAREGRETGACGETGECVKDLLDELISGPVGDLHAAVPEAAAVKSVHLEGDLAVVDLTAPFAAELPSGSSAEMMAVYSIVNTICINFPQIARVRITVEGNQKTILNHLDLTDPLPPDYSLEQGPTETTPAGPSTRPAPAVTKGRP
jgi:Sporulation and spore germination